MAKRRTKSALEIMEQSSRIQQKLYHMKGGTPRYKKVAAISKKYLDTIAKRNGYKGFVDQFNNNRESVPMRQTVAFNKQYSRASYANGVG